MNKVTCEFEYCLYNRQNECTLSEPPTINSLGMCEECIMLELDKNFREAEKTRQLNELEARWDTQSHSIRPT
ncbi:MAG: hypothetical protein FWC77_04610 [Defluviitaleaceae bacterium]|nr:hypothetical protein [Defluviitaleaceae bacterium]